MYFSPLYFSNTAGIPSDPGGFQSFRLLMGLVVSSIDRSSTLTSTSWPAHSGNGTSGYSLFRSSSKYSRHLVDFS